VEAGLGGSLVRRSAASPVIATVGGCVSPCARLPVVPRESITRSARGRVRVGACVREDDVDALLSAEVVVGVGRGVAPEHYGELDDLLEVLGAELGATRKVTDQGWLPHARQIGITGHSLSPRLVVAIGSSGRFNHMVGVRSAGTVLAVNPDPEAPCSTSATSASSATGATWCPSWPWPSRWPRRADESGGARSHGTPRSEFSRGRR
jgi:electron transfer flavoprotein alpha subunit